MVLVKQKDIDGLVALLKDIKNGKVTIVAQALAQLQGEAPGIFKLIVSISAQLKLTANIFMGALEPPQKDLLAKVKKVVLDHNNQFLVGCQNHGSGNGNQSYPPSKQANVIGCPREGGAPN